MLKRVIAVAVLILAVMLVAKDGRLMRKVNLTGSCHAVSTMTDGAQILACHPGKLEGAPSLSNQGCVVTGASGKLEYWRCDASVDASQVGR